MEYQKPNHGLLAYLQPKAEVRNRHTGEVLLSGSSKRAALIEYMEWIRTRRAEREAALRERIEAEGGNTETNAQTADRRSLRYRGGPGGRLENADLRDLDLSGADLSGIRLRSAYCEGVDFQHARLNDAQLERTVFEGANFRDSMLTGANLSEANLSNAILVNVMAKGGDFQHADFTGSDLSGGDFSGADLSGANLANVAFNLSSNFSGAMMGNARNIAEPLRLHAEKSGAVFHVAEQQVAE